MKLHPYTYFHNLKDDRLFQIIDFVDINDRDDVILLEVKEYKDMETRKAIPFNRAMFIELINSIALTEVLPFIKR